MTLEEARNHFTQYLKRIGRSKETIDTYGRNVKQFASFLNDYYPRVKSVEEVTAEIATDYQDYLTGMEDDAGRTLSRKTLQLKLVSLRVFFRFLTREDIIRSDPTKQIVLPKSERRLTRSVLSEEEICSIFASCDLRTPIGLRNRAILEVLYACGIRTSELCNLKTNDIDLRGQTITIENGKGGKSRIVPIGQYATHYLSEYLKKARGCFLRNTASDSGIVFLTTFGNAFDRKSINKHVMRPIERELKLKKSLTCYSFRHTCASHILQHGIDVSYIARLLGHASLNTTQQYLHIEIGDLKKAHAQYHPREKNSIIPTV